MIDSADSSLGMRGDQAAADLLGEPGRALGEAQADVVHLHDAGDDAVHRDRDHHGDHEQDDQPRQEGLGRPPR